MTPLEKNDGAPREDVAALRRTLMGRMAAAALMIVALLGGLAVFDYLSAPERSEAAPPQFTEPVPVAKRIVPPPVAATPVVEPPGTAAPADEARRQAAVPESSAAPVDPSAPVVETPIRSETRPARPAAGVHRPTPAPVPAPAPAPEASGAPVVKAGPGPAAHDAATAATAATPDSPPSSGFSVLTAALPDVQRAEEVQASLRRENIPARLETRLQLGPFRSRAEAEAALAALKTMGVAAVVKAPPKRGKRSSGVAGNAP